MRNDPAVVILPEFDGNPLIVRLPPLMDFGQALKALRQAPIYSDDERRLPARWRRECVQRLKRYFEPLAHHLDLEASFGTMVRQGYVGRNPLTPAHVERIKKGRARIEAEDLSAHPLSISPTASGFSLVGCSGVGKSKSIERILELYPQVIHHTEPYSFDQVVWMKLDCPHDGSLRMLCIRFFQEIDRLLGTKYEQIYTKNRQSVDRMLTYVAQVASIHCIGAIIIDELQHLLTAKDGNDKKLMNFLVTMVNTVGVPILTIGTLAALPMLTQSFRMARRANGVGSAVWSRLERDEDWEHFIGRLWSYQWTKQISPLTNEIRELLWHESQGIIDVVLKLFILCQMRVIREGELFGTPEIIDVELIKEVAADSLKYIRKMLDALKRDDQKALLQYDDLLPLHMVFEAEMDKRLRPADMGVFRAEPKPPAPISSQVGLDRKFLSVLTGMFAPDVSEIIARECLRELPDGELPDLMSLALAKYKAHDEPMFEHGPVAQIKPKKAKATSSVTGTRALGDMVKHGKARGQNAYEALKSAGMMVDFQAILAA